MISVAIETRGSRLTRGIKIAREKPVVPECGKTQSLIPACHNLGMKIVISIKKKKPKDILLCFEMVTLILDQKLLRIYKWPYIV